MEQCRNCSISLKKIKEDVLRGRLSHILVILLFILCPLLASAASLPNGMTAGGGDGSSYNEGYDNNSSTDPMLQRLVNGGTAFTTMTDAVDGWAYTNQAPAEPFEYWTNSTYGPFMSGDTLVFTNGDTISLWTGTGTYPGYLESYLIRWGGADHPLGATMYFQDVPIEDSTFPLLLLVVLYGSFKIRKRKKALN
jgi:hypothetical protein